MMKEDVLYLYLLPDASSEPRPARLPRLAAAYTAERGLPAGGFTLQKQAYGKPFFPLRPEICFSISHSGALWVAAFYSRPVGVDIQRHESSVTDYTALAKRWFSAEEYALVREQGAAAFYAIWCAKESWLKQRGDGLSDDMRRFSVVKNGALATQCEGLELRRLPCPAGYDLAVCAERLNIVTIMDCYRQQPL